MNQICCLNPNCDNPSVPDTNQLCPDCKMSLVLLRHRYRPVKSLGQGGFGKTYLAMDNDKFGEKCVIKQLAPQAGSTAAVQKARELFEQEARQLQKLQHEQIPDLKAYFCEGSYFYFVQDFIEGDNLLAELKRGVFDEQKTLRLLNELLPVLKYIHDLNIIHRDIKPENMMRRRSDGCLFLIDFGVSKQLQGTILTGTSIGTFGYAPLEQMKDGKVSPASDLFSVGATCFHLLTGTHPWEVWHLQGYGWVQEWRQHLKQPVSPQFGTVLDKLLALYPEDRYQSAVDVLNAFNSSQPKKTPPPPPQPPPGGTGKTAVVQPPIPPQAKWKWVAVLVVGLVVSILVLVNPVSVLDSPEATAREVRVTTPSVVLESDSREETAQEVQVTTPSVVLESDRGVDYSPLQELLRQGRWKEADRETVDVMLKAANREGEGWLSSESIQQFPCTDLRTIDQLWVKYSDGRFGFSVQRQIYQDSGAQLDGKYPGNEIWYRFADKVGWRVGEEYVYYVYYDELNFNTSAPEGQLPRATSRIGGVGWVFSRTANCNL